jgi:glutamate racemase
MNIGVFDSGKGGLAVANAIRLAFPEHSVEFVYDVEHLPYGDKSPEELLTVALPPLRKLAKQCDVVVIACNTLTTNVIGKLRQQIPIPLVGIEPMVKPAAKMTNSGVIAICATPATLNSQRYAFLKESYAKDLKVLEPDCSQWATMIEANSMRRHHIHEQITSLCDAGADVIVLGCTHFHWIEEMVNEAAAGKATVIQPEQAIVKRLRRVLQGISD